MQIFFLKGKFERRVPRWWKERREVLVSPGVSLSELLTWLAEPASSLRFLLPCTLPGRGAHFCKKSCSFLLWLKSLHFHSSKTEKQT